MKLPRSSQIACHLASVSFELYRDIKHPSPRPVCPLPRGGRHLTVTIMVAGTILEAPDLFPSPPGGLPVHPAVPYRLSAVGAIRSWRARVRTVSSSRFAV